MLGNIERVLVLAPHTDDGEFGCGATLSRLVRSGADVHYLAFSACEESVPKGFASDILRHEVIAATAELGIPNENVECLSFRVRYFAEARQDILQTLIETRKRINPQLVFAPSLDDVHQDHHAVAVESVRAFKHTNLLHYELPWNNMAFRNTVFMSVDEADLDRKANAVARYESQAGRVYSDPDFLRSQARFRGLQGGCELAEVFEAVRLVIE